MIKSKTESPDYLKPGILVFSLKLCKFSESTVYNDFAVRESQEQNKLNFLVPLSEVKIDQQVWEKEV